MYNEELPFQCGICLKKFRSKNRLGSHKTIHIGEKPFQCGICLKKFSQKNCLKSHMTTHTGEKPFQCETCLKKFSQKSSLNTHTAIIHIGEKPYTCEVCYKKFSLKFYLESHTRVHTGEKPYECEICGKRFSQKSGLNSHMKTHSKTCVSSFSLKSSLSSPMKIHSRHYVCSICSNHFLLESDLVIHREITGCKPFICKINTFPCDIFCLNGLNCRSHTRDMNLYAEEKNIKYEPEIEFMTNVKEESISQLDECETKIKIESFLYAGEINGNVQNGEETKPLLMFDTGIVKVEPPDEIHPYKASNSQYDFSMLLIKPEPV